MLPYYSVLVAKGRAFLALYRSATAPGRARLLDGSSARGPFSFWRRVPALATPDIHQFLQQQQQPPSHRTPRTGGGLFSFVDPSADFAAALSLDLLLLPCVPGEGDVTYCHRCLFPPPDVVTPADTTPIQPADRHHLQCAVGIRRQKTCHDPAVRAFAIILRACFGAASVLFDEGEGAGALARWMHSSGAGLAHTPDIVVLGLDGPGTYRLIEVKTFDPTGPSYITGASTTATDRDLVHQHIARDSRRGDYHLSGPGARTLPDRMRLTVVTVSVFGSLGPEVHTLMSLVSRRSGRRIPTALLPEVSWSAPALAPLARAAIGFAARRGLAESVTAHYRRARTMPSAAAPPAPPPPPAPPAPRAPLAAMFAPVPPLAPVAPPGAAQADGEGSGDDFDGGMGGASPAARAMDFSGDLSEDTFSRSGSFSALAHFH